jgi:hypothetical protein
MAADISRLFCLEKLIRYANQHCPLLKKFLSQASLQIRPEITACTLYQHWAAKA